VTRSDGAEVVLAALGGGELIGEMNLADSLGRSANVITLEDKARITTDGDESAMNLNHFTYREDKRCLLTSVKPIADI
jgi:hypothetical protein